MRRSLGVRFATIVLVAAMAAPAVAAPSRDESPFGELDRAISRVVKQIRRVVKPLSDILQAPK